MGSHGHEAAFVQIAKSKKTYISEICFFKEETKADPQKLDCKTHSQLWLAEDVRASLSAAFNATEQTSEATLSVKKLLNSLLKNTCNGGPNKVSVHFFSWFQKK